MKNYLSINDIDSLSTWVKEAISLKKQPRKFKELGRDKTIGLLFFNNSLRTRLSTQKAAMNLDQGTSEHIKEAAQVISQYCDIIAIRAFAGLVDKKMDEAEEVLNGFKKYANVPIVNMESSVGHPLQALTDAITMEEQKFKNNPKVVLSWAPHPKALPHAVANSFVQMMQKQNADFVITHPVGYELDPDITKDSKIEHDQDKALENADFVYVKNWSSYTDYGQIKSQDKTWQMTLKKLGSAKFMHCLPVRRNVVVADEVLDSKQSLVIEQANNRTFAAQLVLKKILEDLK